jgi:hypothetical protein
VSISHPKIIFWVDQPEIITFLQLLLRDRLLSAIVMFVIGSRNEIDGMEGGSSDSDAVEPALNSLDEFVYKCVDVGK